MLKLVVIALIGSLAACGPARWDNRIAGPKGDTGAPGADGAPGKDASCTATQVAACSVLPNGGAKLSCSDGSNVLISNGAKGATGSTGATGASGSPGLVFSSVQFCTGTTTYPSTFLEVGFCINNTLYAVYSANNGFLFVVPPGNYTSQAIGSSCNFTVKPNCVISH